MKAIKDFFLNDLFFSAITLSLFVAGITATLCLFLTISAINEVTNSFEQAFYCEPVKNVSKSNHAHNRM